MRKKDIKEKKYKNCENVETSVHKAVIKGKKRL